VAEQESGEAIRPEAFERVKQEKDELKAQVAALSDVVRDTKFIDDAYQHFKGIDGVKDPYAIARAAVKDVTLKGLEGEEFGTKLDAWYNDTSSLFTPTQPSEPIEPDVPVADTAPAPAFARPNPAAEGAPPDAGKQMIETTSPEFKKLIEANDQAALQRLDQEGLINWKTPVV
jgi:hypothetical protein